MLENVPRTVIIPPRIHGMSDFRLDFATIITNGPLYCPKSLVAVIERRTPFPEPFCVKMGANS